MEKAGEGAKESIQLGTYGGLPLTLTLEKDDSLRGLLSLDGKLRHKQSIRSPNSDKLLEYLLRMTDTLQEKHAETVEKLENAQQRLTDFESRLGQDFPHTKRFVQLSEMRAVLQSLLQDEVQLETIYEQHGNSSYIPHCPDEATLTQALVQAFEQWMKPEGKASEVTTAHACERNLSEVAEQQVRERESQFAAVAA